MIRQLALPLPTRAARGRDDFLVAAPNRTALAQIDDWRNWPGRKLVLTGPSGAGKSHLAHVWATDTGAEILDPDSLPGRLDRPLPEGAHLVIDDADRIASETGEVALFALHNMAQTQGCWLLVTGTGPLSDWPLRLPDLRSRLQAAACARIANPDDQLLSALLLKQFDDRQLSVDPGVIAYLARRIERSFAAARDIVETIDRAALAAGRPITRPFVAGLLESRADSTDT